MISLKRLGFPSKWKRHLHHSQYGTSRDSMFSLSSQIGHLLERAQAECYPSFRLPIILRPSAVASATFESQMPMQIAHRENIQDKSAILRAMQAALPPNNIISSLRLSPSNWLVVSIRDSYLLSSLSSVEYLLHAQTQPSLFESAPRKHGKILIDYSSPNMSKELHVGHLRSTLIGACLASVLTHLGHEVEHVSHVGDFGAPLGMVVAEAERLNLPFVQLLKAGKDVPDSALPLASELSRLYADAKGRSTTDKEFAATAKRLLLDIQRPANERNLTKQVWECILRATRVSFSDIYERLGITIPEKGESFYVDFIPSALEELQMKGILEISEEALVYWPDREKAPLLIKSRDGAFLYAASDLAALKYRIQSGFNRVLYVTDLTQRPHFDQIFEIGLKAGWYSESDLLLQHVGFDVVTDQKGKKLSSRDGTPYPLLTLLQDAVVATSAALTEKAQSTKPQSDTTGEAPPLDPETALKIQKDAPLVAYNAIKYYELSNVRRHKYKFSFEDMLNMKGNTSMYLLYIYARVGSLLTKAKNSGLIIPSLSEATQDPSQIIETDVERFLYFKLLQFPDALERVNRALEPNHLCLYLYEMGMHFNQFYESCRVIGSERESERLKLCVATRTILSKGLQLVHVTSLERL